MTIYMDTNQQQQNFGELVLSMTHALVTIQDPEDWYAFERVKSARQAFERGNTELMKAHIESAVRRSFAADVRSAKEFMGFVHLFLAAQ